ncbi:hypothetical protein CYLTODRAFT_443396 [Cylindrobasidium torrendii FP15055 ss-10]|uniref:Uncharacterized protein n=1 Tax=Cylindrobasidium torrendii FP15055 ss-10 TaxID=1314674 RepID=A0A0D7BCY6_9AGAR|nr:hypothetical protein CYLTODRAFT_443396 [Cylindrobasidium torrendii FP15055 ss-10]
MVFLDSAYSSSFSSGLQATGTNSLPFRAANASVTSNANASSFTTDAPPKQPRPQSLSAAAPPTSARPQAEDRAAVPFLDASFHSSTLRSIPRRCVPFFNPSVFDIPFPLSFRVFPPRDAMVLCQDAFFRNGLDPKSDISSGERGVTVAKEREDGEREGRTKFGWTEKRNGIIQSIARYELKAGNGDGFLIRGDLVDMSMSPAMFSTLPSPYPSEAEREFYYSGISPSPLRLVYRTSASARPFFPEVQRRLEYAGGTRVGGGAGGVDVHRSRPTTETRTRTEKNQGWFCGSALGPESSPPPPPRSSPPTSSASCAKQAWRMWTSSSASPCFDGWEEGGADEDGAVRSPSTTALGMGIAPVDKPDREGTIGLYFEVGGRLMGLTCRHVLLDDEEEAGKDVQILGTAAFERLLETISRTKETLHAGDEDDVSDAKKHLKKSYKLLEESNEAIDALEIFYAAVEKDWTSPENRVIGNIHYAPPILRAPLDTSKFDKAFKGSFVDLARPQTPISHTHRTVFELPLRRIVPSSSSSAPFIVLKNGSASGLTFGRSSSLTSFVRDPQTGAAVTLWPVFNDLPVRGGNRDCPAFAAPGDSGTAVVDAQGRVLGMLVGSAASDEENVDVSYVLPMESVWEDVRRVFPDATLC